MNSIGSATAAHSHHAMQSLFAKKDTNTDGKLDGGEIQSLLDTIQSNDASGTSSLTSDDVVSAFDTDGDGAVCSSEFDTGFKKLAETMHGSMLSLQESGGLPPGPPPGPPPQSNDASNSDDNADDDTAVSQQLLDLLQSYGASSDEDEEATSTGTDATGTDATGTDATGTDATGSGDSTNTLIAAFFNQLESYAKTQSYGYATETSSVSLSA